MNNQFIESLIEAIKLNADEKKLEVDVVKDLFIESIKKIYLKKFSIENLNLQINLKSKEFSCFRELKVVNSVDDPWEEISINDEEVKKIGLAENEIFQQPFDIQNEFNRIEIQNILQTFRNSINQIINSDIVKEWGNRKGDIVYAEVESINNDGGVVVNLSNIDGTKQIFGFLPKKEQSPKDKFKEGEKYHFVIQNVIESTKLWPIVVSRASVDLVKYYMTNEIPEIENESIVIKGIGRYPGYKTKVVVESKHKSIKEPVAICIGAQGSRIKEISKLIGGEKIDVYRYYEDIEKQVVALFLSPEISKMSVAFRRDRNYQITSAIIYAPNYEIAKILGAKGCNIKVATDILNIRFEVRDEIHIQKDGLNPKPFSSFDLSYNNNFNDIVTHDEIKPIEEDEEMETYEIMNDDFTNEDFAEDINIFFDEHEKK